MAIVTWSGFGSSSASMWRVSSLSHLASAPSPSGAKEIEPPTCSSICGTASRSRASISLNMDRRLLPLPSASRHMHVQHGGAGVPAVHGLLHLLGHRHRDVVGIAGQEFGAVGGDLDHQGLLVFGQQGVVEELHVGLLEMGRGSAGVRRGASSRRQFFLQDRCAQAHRVDAQHAGQLQHGSDFFLGGAELQRLAMWRRTPGPYMWVHEASTAMARNSIVLASSTPESIGFMPMP